MNKGGSPVMVNIGFGNFIAVSHVVSVLTSVSAPMKRLREEAKKIGKLIDATEGRRTRSIIVTDSDHIILSALQTETLTQRFTSQTTSASSSASLEEDDNETE